MAQEARSQLEGTSGRRKVFYALWAITTAGLTLFLQQGWHDFDSPATLPTLIGLLLCTISLVRWLPKSELDLSTGAASTRRGRFALLIVLSMVCLVALAALVGPPLLFALPAMAVITLIVLRTRLAQGGILTRQALLYVLFLALVAGAVGLGAGWIEHMSPSAWAGLQLALVLTSLPAGWAILKYANMPQIGVTCYLRSGAGPALRGFGMGILLGMPWALGIVLLGGSNGENWVQYWWQPFVAIQPAISEEAWGRVLLVPLLYLLLRQVARGRAALIAAVLVMAYWFAFLHTNRDLSISSLIETLIMGTLYSLPITYLWLRRDLETAIGFHFWLDFVKFSFAYLLNAGLWFV
jgi:hypothetical protein